MNTTVKSVATAGAIAAFMGFTSAPNVPNELDRSFFLRREFFARRETPFAIECWSEFLQDLKKLDAIIYIPEDKRALAERYGLHSNTPDWARSRNAEVTLNFSNLSQMEPGDDSCGSSVRATFSELGMIVLVQRSKVSNRAVKGEYKIFDNTVKLVDGPHNKDNYHKESTPKTNATHKVLDGTINFDVRKAGKEQDPSFTQKFIPVSSIDRGPWSNHNESMKVCRTA